MSIDQYPDQPSLGSLPAFERVQRPFGLKAIVALLLVQAIAGALVVAAYVIGSQNPQVQLSSAPNTLLAASALVISQLALAPLRLAAAIGLWRIHHWAWLLTMMVLAYTLASEIIAFFLTQPNFLMMVLGVVTVFYLNQREVQDLFADRETKVAL
jgi:uncharacterized membrane protein (DUF2068 family)